MDPQNSDLQMTTRMQLIHWNRSTNTSVTQFGK